MPTAMTRKRDAVATRATILAAAKRAFTEKGFDGAGMRDIAARAGVTAALVNRYFGAKEALFEEAVVPALNMDELMAGDRATFGERAVRYLITRSPEGSDLDPTLAFVRSAGSLTVASMLHHAVGGNVISRLAHWLGGHDPEQRAALIVAHIAGFDMMRHVVDVSALGPEHLEALAPRFARTLQRYVDDA